MSSENINFGQLVAKSEELNLYDLHLSSSLRFHMQPDLSGLIEKVPTYLQPTWDDLTQSLEQKLIPGFMGLNLPSDLAAEVLELIERAGGHGLLVPIGYRHPKITIEMAYPIAQQEVVCQQALHLPNYKLEPTKFFREGVLWWDFRAFSPELIEKGHIPGGVIARVDKLDGHIWTDAEQIHLFRGEEYYLESATSLEPMEVLKLAAEQLGLEWSTDYKHSNKPCLNGSALFVGAVKQPSAQNYIKKKYGFRPNVHMWFRLNRYKQGYEVAGPLMMQVVRLVLEHDPADAILVFDESNVTTVLKRTSGQLSVNQRWSSWIAPELAQNLGKVEGTGDR